MRSEAPPTTHDSSNREPWCGCWVQQVHGYALYAFICILRLCASCAFCGQHRTFIAHGIVHESHSASRISKRVAVL